MAPVETDSYTSDRDRDPISYSNIRCTPSVRERSRSCEQILTAANGEVSEKESTESGVAFELRPVEFVENLGCDRREERLALV